MGFPDAKGLCEILRKTCVCLLEGKEGLFSSKGRMLVKVCTRISR